MGIDTDKSNEIHIRPARGWQLINLRELAEYRDLFYFLVWRDIKALYAQTILGFSWAIFAPLIQILIFNIIFGKVAKIDTDGYPNFLYYTMTMIPWVYMSNALSASSQSLIGNSAMLGKVYFPRLIYPVIPILSKLVDFSISFVFVLLPALIYFYYKGVIPGFTLSMLYLPIFILLMMIVSAAIGMWLSALAIRYRDVKFAMRFIIQLLVYSAPIIYPLSKISENYPQYEFLYTLNPIVAVIEGFRSCMLGIAIPWEHIVPGVIVALFLLVLGALYFKRMEHVFVDVI